MNTSVTLRILQDNEVYLLEECLKDLAEHHNKVSTYFQGHYPNQPYEKYGFKVKSHILYRTE